MRDGSSVHSVCQGEKGQGKREREKGKFYAKMRAEAERLIAEGKMPPLEKVLAAVEQTRRKYRQRILDAREQER